ncbi:hypothetical protein CBF58_07385 [Lactobacillus taiwanensis]|uniref:Uncharacterized protein n=1 Tax=Lactobacillus taiwanensis TaxID=508451 RepID=A0A256L9D1_9LACO|nr:DUF5406 domain-containing protein [Lactobacillus taiwanensis]OYR87158.1 hypothetical protein CBF53_09215 [Lactobacillus taiwanensis]OYR90029.1 hypothetical protein CBF70_10275 [Lactobacillus taiwanensis]OYR95339.1 hypothetical protein CBF58_07385 [Lactobacillus taiwanensis]
MKSFDPNYIYRFSKKTIKLTFQQWEYQGFAFVEIGGNCAFVNMLSEFQDGDSLLSLLKQKTSKLDFDFEDLGQDEEGKSWFRAVLVSATGEKCETEDFLDSLPEMLVGIELVDIQTED